MAVSQVSGTCFDPRHPPAAAFDQNAQTFFSTTGLYPQAVMARFTRGIKIDKVRLLGSGIRRVSIRLKTAFGGKETRFERVMEGEEMDTTFALSDTPGQSYTSMTVCVEEGGDNFSVLRIVSVFPADGPSVPIPLKTGIFTLQPVSSAVVPKRSLSEGNAFDDHGSVHPRLSPKSGSRGANARSNRIVSMAEARTRVNSIGSPASSSASDHSPSPIKFSRQPMNRAAVVKRITDSPPQTSHKAAKMHLRRLSLRAGTGRCNGKGKPLIKSPRPDDLERLLSGAGAGVLLANNSMNKRMGGSNSPSKTNNSLQKALMAFREADTDSDGVLSASEVGSMIASLLARKSNKKPKNFELEPRYKRVVSHLMWTYDGDRSGGLDFEEFMLLHGAVKKTEVTRQQRLLEAMQTVAELRADHLLLHKEQSPSVKTTAFYQALLPTAISPKHKSRSRAADANIRVHAHLQSDESLFAAVIALFAEPLDDAIHSNEMVCREHMLRSQVLKFLRRHKIAEDRSDNANVDSGTTADDAMLQTMMRLRSFADGEPDDQTLAFEHFCQLWSPVLREQVSTHNELLEFFGDQSIVLAEASVHVLTPQQRSSARKSFWDLLRRRHSGTLNAGLLTKAAMIFFRECDMDGNHVLDAAELTQLLSKLEFPATAASDVELLLRAYDLDGDGTLSYAEFSTFWADAKLIDKDLSSQAQKDLQHRKDQARQRTEERKYMRKWSTFWKVMQQQRATGGIGRPIDAQHLAKTAAIFFNECDKGRTGLLDEGDLLQVLQKLDCGAVQPSDVKDMLSVYDTDDDGKLDLEEFARFFVDVRSLERQAQEKRDELLEADKHRHHKRLEARLTAHYSTDERS